MLYDFIFSPMPSTCSDHLTFFGLNTFLTSGKGKSCEFLHYAVSAASCCFHPLKGKYLSPLEHPQPQSAFFAYVTKTRETKQYRIFQSSRFRAADGQTRTSEASSIRIPRTYPIHTFFVNAFLVCHVVPDIWNFHIFENFTRHPYTDKYISNYICERYGVWIRSHLSTWQRWLL
jgi:hypothetical protein